MFVLADGERSRSAYRLQVMIHLFAAPAVLAFPLGLLLARVQRSGSG